MRSGIKWSFKTERFRVALHIERDRGYRYDGDDPDGEVQAKLDSGEYVAFNSTVFVELDGNEIARDTLGGSVYEDGKEPEFWTGHRDPDPANRNTLAQKASGVCIGHYFPDMVREACREARIAVSMMPIPPRVREGAI